MDEYFLILTAIDVVVLLFICMLIYESENLSRRQRRGFLRTYILIAAIYFRGGHFHVYVFMFAVSIVYLAVATAAILTTKDLADQNMYQFKKARKALQDKLK